MTLNEKKKLFKTHVYFFSNILRLIIKFTFKHIKMFYTSMPSSISLSPLCTHFHRTTITVSLIWCNRKHNIALKYQSIFPLVIYTLVWIRKANNPWEQLKRICWTNSNQLTANNIKWRILTLWIHTVRRCCLFTIGKNQCSIEFART